MTLIVVRGTEFWRVSDWLEDVRMWTEPVVFTLLSFVFPSIHAWSPQAYAMVTDTYHSLLHILGLSDPEYKFHRLVRYIENKVQDGGRQKHLLRLQLREQMQRKLPDDPHLQGVWQTWAWDDVGQMPGEQER